MAIDREKIRAVLDKLTPEDSRLWSAVNSTLGEDFSDEQWEHTLRSFLAYQRPDLLRPDLIGEAVGPLPFSVLPPEQVAGMASSIESLDAIERRLGYRTDLFAETPARLALAERALAASVVMTRTRFLAVLTITLGVGVVIGYLVARRRYQQTAARSRWA